MDQQQNAWLKIDDLARELGMMHITIMQLRAENEELKKRLAKMEGDE